jgi:hypothetical protein
MRTALANADEPPCSCPGPGFCERYGIDQGDYTHALCQGRSLPGLPNCSAQKSQAYREKWAARRDGRAESPAERQGAPLLAPPLPAAAPVARAPAAAKQADRLARFQRAACIHQGAATGEQHRCPACGGAVTVEVFGCALHGECTRAKLLPASRQPAVPCCRICPDYTPPAGPGEGPPTGAVGNGGDAGG